MTLREFAIALLVGMLTGAYSSIFVASPLLGWLKARSPLFAGRRSGAGDHLVGDDLRAVVIAGPGGVRQVSDGAAAARRPPARPAPPEAATESPAAAATTVASAAARPPADATRRARARRSAARPTADRRLRPVVRRRSRRPGAEPRRASVTSVMTGDAATPGDAAQVDRPTAWLRSLVRDIPDYPEPGVTFRDITPLLGDAGGLPPGASTSSPTASPTSRSTGSSASRRAASSSPPRSPTASAPRSCRCARPASCRGRSCARSTSWSTAPTSWRSTATPSTPTSGCWSSTTCWPPAARRRPRAGWSRRSAASIVGIGILIEISALGGRAALGERRLEVLASVLRSAVGTVDRVLPWRRHHEAAAPAELTPLLASYRRRHPKAPVATINRAYQVAAEAHRSQLRSSGESYINHPLAVARIVADIGLDEISVAAALLHDAVEDTEITLADVEAELRAEVAAIVDGVTKLERIQFDSREAQQAATMRKMLVAMARDLRVLVIKLADRLHNMRTIAAMPIAEAAAHRPGDARHLRPAGPPPRDAGDQAAARGPLVRRPAPEALRRARPPRQQPLARARGVPRRGDRRGPQPASPSSASTPRSPAAASTCGASTRRWSSRAASSTTSSTSSRCA